MKRPLIVGGTMLIAVVFSVLFMGREKDSPRVSAEEAYQMLQRDSTILVLDVRTPGEYTGPLNHIEPSLLIPLQNLESRVTELDEYRSTTILAVCRTGRRSGIATEFLVARGFNVMNIEGGLVRWNQLKLPVAYTTQ